MNKLFLFCLYSFTIFYDLKLIFNFLSFSNLALFLIGLTTLLKKDILKFYFNDDLDKKKINFLIYCFFFIILITIIDLIHQLPINDILISFFTKVCILLILPFTYYLYLKKKFNFLNHLNSILFIHSVFIFFQLLGYDINISNLIPKNLLITVWSSDIIINENLKRLTGAVSNPIFFSYQLLFIFAYNFIEFWQTKTKKSFLFLTITLLFMFLAQSRAAIGILLPCIFLSYLIFVKFKIKYIFYFMLIFSITWISYINLIPSIENYLPYLTKTISISDTHRTLTNYYISLGIIKESPFIGINPSEAWNIFEKYSETNYANIYSRNEEVPTHHNQFFFFLRYYGLIGLFFFIFLIFKIVFLIKENNIFEYKYLIGLILMLDIAYSLTHNNKLISPWIWIFINFIFIKKEQKIK